MVTAGVPSNPAPLKRFHGRHGELRRGIAGRGKLRQAWLVGAWHGKAVLGRLGMAASGGERHGQSWRSLAMQAGLGGVRRAKVWWAVATYGRQGKFGQRMSRNVSAGEPSLGAASYGDVSHGAAGTA